MALAMFAINEKSPEIDYCDGQQENDSSEYIKYSPEQPCLQIYTANKIILSLDHLFDLFDWQIVITGFA